MNSKMKLIFLLFTVINLHICLKTPIKYNNYSTKFWEKGLIDSISDLKVLDSGDILLTTKNGILAKLNESNLALTDIKNKYTYNNKSSKIFTSEKCKLHKFDIYI